MKLGENIHIIKKDIKKNNNRILGIKSKNAYVQQKNITNTFL